MARVRKDGRNFNGWRRLTSDGPGLDKRYTLLAAALILLIGLPVLSGFVGMGWELSQFAGLGAAALCIGLCGAPVRARDASPPSLLSLRRHTLIGWIATAAVTLHVGGLVLADRQVVEYLKPSMPIYMAAGALAALLLLLLVTSSALPVRRYLWSNHRAFQASHVIAGGLLIVLVAVHVIATGRYAGSHARGVLTLVATVGAMLMLLRRRRPPDVRTASAHAERRLVFGRHSALVAIALVSTSLGLVGLMVSPPVTALREPLASRATSLPLNFPHGRHLQVNCLTCHHNFADGTGFENCILCHKSGRPDLKAGVQARFHAFCFECHRHPQAGIVGHGPVGGCALCHRTPEDSGRPSGLSTTR
jgi:DMSO/TMAO reductase YedYZ heme-binding membrane subunit